MVISVTGPEAPTGLVLVLLEALDPEQLGPDRLLHCKRSGDYGVSGAHTR